MTMPDKQLTIATYAAGASLAAITLIYVFAPTFFLDGDSTTSTAGFHKKTVVGLFNPGNDCFINAVLQALAGLGDLRVYLIRETHRRKLDGLEMYLQVVEDPARKGLSSWKLEGLQLGTVTYGLKEILNALNERPLYKKTISAGGFIKVLEEAFRQKISIQQQDAQEFFQVVAERLCDEYHAGQRARHHAKVVQSRNNSSEAFEKLSTGLESNGPKVELTDEETQGVTVNRESEAEEVLTVKHEYNHFSSEHEEGFPLEGGSESQIECLTCGFKPKPTTTTFCSLTLNLPQVSSTSLSSCFDQMFKTEHIEDFKCEKCRLVHALDIIKNKMSRSDSESFRLKSINAMEVIQKAIEKNTEDDLKSIELPDMKFAPKRKIARHIQITNFPKILAIHLSRSIFDAGHFVLKNSAKVAFPELLPLGGLLNKCLYRLSSVVCHKGSHNSGHYESFRRQTINAPYSTPDTFKPAKVYSNSISTATPLSIPKSHVAANQSSEESSTDVSTSNSTPRRLSTVATSNSSFICSESNSTSGQIPFDGTTDIPTASKNTEKREPIKLRTRARSTLSRVSSFTPKKTEVNTNTEKAPISGSRNLRAKKKHSDRWWRISDDKIKECKTADVLGMQREVYLLFYELETES
ncbi:Ubiquitin carboxyl-terminal hydrolase 16 [Golovinomyces cichoracearum]|uniref:Ubiquitin carboxyl-terminal hydrolase n=1 Tax=Golovinomyces cichoracearum TaxID=62708 RepID=A0A420IR69_9PEZI|nr:Ubiquitin carboxyl-terminal hydrolase 16 [Golovinomyces cichoracearum]